LVARERATRYSEYVGVVDGVLRSSARPFSFEGPYYRTTNATLAPAPPQQPRPPLIIGSRSATGRALAVQCGECWNTYALTGEGSAEEIAGKTRRRNTELDERCAEISRNHGTLRRSLVMWPPLDPWVDADGFKRIVETFLPTASTSSSSCGPGTIAERSSRVPQDS
jgi:alkanesulfonate monooxygenase SsuD/methylene tetrahydromethanopterin reductase-like flavin-dependent oxidoreductase (luciferase family)